jgi:hypothetical protein
VWRVKGGGLRAETGDWRLATGDRGLATGNYPRPTKVTPAQMIRTAIHRNRVIGSLKQTFDMIMTSTYPRLKVG